MCSALLFRALEFLGDLHREIRPVLLFAHCLLGNGRRQHSTDYVWRWLSTSTA